MPSLIPFFGSVHNYRVGTVIEGRHLYFDARWNTRDASWRFNVLDDKEEEIALGIRVTLGTLLTKRIKDERFPNVFLMAIDLTDSNKEAGFDDFGSRVVVASFTYAEAGKTEPVYRSWLDFRRQLSVIQSQVIAPGAGSGLFRV